MRQSKQKINNYFIKLFQQDKRKGSAVKENIFLFRIFRARFSALDPPNPNRMETELTKPKTELKPAEGKLPAISDDFGEYAGDGMENVTASDILIPRIGILQALSPQINKRKPEYLDGSEQGMICDIGLGELFPDGIIFLPCYYSKVYLEWFPRESDKGLAEIHHSAEILDQTTRNDRNQPILPSGNYVAETAQFFGMNITAGGRRSFIPMSSTALKRARSWLTLATGEKLKRGDGSEFTPPLWYRSYRLTTVPDGNAQGDWFTWKVERGPSMPELGEELGLDWKALRAECIDFTKQLSEGRARGDLAGTQDEPSSPSADGSM